MPEMILPSGEYALVAHPTEWAKRPFILVDGQWYNFNSRQGVAASRSSETAVREAILNDGYRPVFFGLKIERPEPARVTFTYENTQTAAERLQAWARLNVAVNEANEPFQEFNDRIESNHTYQRQAELYERWRTGLSTRGVRSPGGYVVDGVDTPPPARSYGEPRSYVISHTADEPQSYSYSTGQPIPNPYHDDTTRRYPTSEQVTARRRR